MPEIVYPQDSGEPIVVDLRDPYWAAFLAWIWPGAGHFYQRRFAKGFLFMICVLSTYFLGLGLGHGRVVYASFKPGDMRWIYIGQLGVGAPALPAMVQSMKTKNGADPFWVLCERFPEDYQNPSMAFQRITENNANGYEGRTYKDGFMAPPAGPVNPTEMSPNLIQSGVQTDTLGRWHFDYKHFFELGTLYTVIAGLLNLLAIYDAFCGPAILTPAQRERLESKKKRRSRQ
jgi:TM2 domain-containing membrane protein YozV